MSNKIIIVNRLNWIDWAKTIAILFVVFGHIPEKNGSFGIYYTYLFHMPLFFFISGFLTKKEYFCSTTLKNIGIHLSSPISATISYFTPTGLSNTS